MCYSANVSLFTFIVGMISSIACFQIKDKNYKIIGVFFGFVICMQLIEYLLWNHQKCDNYNKTLSILGMILNHLQPIVLFFVIKHYNKKAEKLWPMLLLYLCFIIPYSIQFLKSKDLCTIKGKGGHLSWNWNKLPYAGIVYIAFLMSMVIFSIYGFPSMSQGILFSIISVLSFIFSVLIYKNVETVGAMWCFFAVFAPVFYILLNFFKNKNSV
jgi:hypothetical protein